MAGLTTTRIGAACRADWKAISTLQNLCFPGDPTSVDKAEFNALIVGEGGQVIVARRGMNLIGYLVMRRKRFLPWESVAFLAVCPDHRSLGVAKLLADEAVAKSRRFFLRLHVRPSNNAALSLYRRLGFVVTDTRENNYDNGEAALAMMRWNGLVFWHINTEPKTLVGNRAAKNVFDGGALK